MNLASELSEIDFWDENKIFGIADRRRMRDISFISTLLVFMKKGIDEDIANANLNQVYDLYNDEYPDKEKDRSKFTSLVEEIDKVIDSNTERIKILKRQVHFYSFFTVSFDLLNKQSNLSKEQVSNYRNFNDNYENEEVLGKYYPDLIRDIYQFKSLVKEGTRQKSNRFERYRILKKIILNK